MHPQTSISCRLWLLFVLVTGAIAVPAEVVTGQQTSVEAEVLLARFLKEAPAGWERWQQQMLSSEVRVRDTLRVTSNNPAELARDQTLHIYLRNGSTRLAISKPLPNGALAESVSVRRGTEYRFAAERSQGGNLALKEVVERPKPSTNPLHPAMREPFTMEHVAWPELVVEPRFHATRAELVRDVGNEELIRIHFTYDSDYLGKEMKHKRFEEGFADFRPDLNWALRKYEIIYREKGTKPDRSDGQRLGRGGERVYGPTQDGFIPMLRSVCSYYDLRERKVNVEESYDYEIFRPCTEPSSFFSFEAVGLPDVTRRARVDWYWLGLVNLIVVLVVAAGWRMRRQGT